MTLKELKNLVKPADLKKRIPSAAFLKKQGGRIVVRETVGLDADITVYANGYVLYREGEKATVFPLHTCGAYEYGSTTGKRSTLQSEFFDNENWYMRLLVEGADLMERNQEQLLLYHNVCSYNPFSEEWGELRDQEQDILERIAEKEMFRDLMSVLTEKQRKAVTLYYLENMKQEDISKEMGIVQQSVCNMIKRAVSAMKKRLEETENKKI